MDSKTPNQGPAQEAARRRLARLRERHGGAAAHNKVWKSKNPEKAKAHKTVENAIKAGKLIRRPCEECGAPKAQAHHEDYSKPLEVKWLCAKDHRKRHREIDANQAAVHADGATA